MFIVLLQSIIFAQTACSGFIVCYLGEAQHLPKQATSIGSFREDKASPLNGFSLYQRFRLETKEAPPRHKQPRQFNPRVSKVGLANTLLREVLRLGLKLKRREYRRALLSRPCIYGVFSGRFGGFHPIKDCCTGCMRCFQEYPGVCNVERNPEFFKFADPYWIPDDPNTSSYSSVSTIAYEASTGTIPIKGMGYKGSFAGRGWDSIWTDMSEIVRPTRDGVYGREYISTLVDLGRKPKFLEFSSEGVRHSSKTVEIALPMIFDYLPPNLNSQSILSSIARASRQVRTFFIASPEQAKSVPEDHRKQLIPLVSPSTMTVNHDTILRASAVELLEYSNVALEQIREINPILPICVRLPLTKNADRTAMELAREGVDTIHLCANYHGEGWDDEDPMLVKDLIRSVHRTLVKEALRDDVTLIASGGITLAEHVPKAIMCGADLVALDTTILVALQTEFSGECVSSDRGRIKGEKFDSRWGEQRLVNLLASWHDQLIEILSAMGMRDVRRLRGDVGRAMFNENLEREAFADIARRA
jgi:hypothetical protein